MSTVLSWHRSRKQRCWKVEDYIRRTLSLVTCLSDKGRTFQIQYADGRDVGCEHESLHHDDRGRDDDHDCDRGRGDGHERVHVHGRGRDHGDRGNVRDHGHGHDRGSGHGRGHDDDRGHDGGDHDRDDGHVR